MVSEFIHPFADGNGRTGRFWQTLILRRWKPIFAWLPVESLIHERQAGYYEALIDANSQGESTVFAAFMPSVIRDALKEIKENQNRHVVENVGINVGENVVEKRKVLLTILRRNPRITAKEIGSLMNISSRQAERLLAGLKSDGTVTRQGSPKKGWWEINE